MDGLEFLYRKYLSKGDEMGVIDWRLAEAKEKDDRACIWESKVIHCFCDRIEPLWPNGGVVVNAWQKNDQNHYEVKCPACKGITTVSIDIQDRLMEKTQVYET